MEEEAREIQGQFRFDQVDDLFREANQISTSESVGTSHLHRLEESFNMTFGRNGEPTLPSVLRCSYFHKQRNRQVCQHTVR